MDAVDIQAVESKLSDVTVTAIPMTKQPLTGHNPAPYREVHNAASTASSTNLSSSQSGLSKYAQLLNVIEEMGKEVRPTYAGSRSSAERLKRSIVSARILVKECLLETERSARQ
ncbi:hypothetical protein ABEB36_009840 [Hypothenemus hampei]|uniref:Cyclin-dependent kinase 2-associated protein 1 n=1 Tax=Hypothenemus hampei TaxID=57062 RepID=A0ABD1EHM8_HYPHA